MRRATRRVAVIQALSGSGAAGHFYGRNPNNLQTSRKKMLRFARLSLLLALLLLAGLLVYGQARSHPEDMPWTALDLSRPVGAFHGRKLAALSGEGAACRALLGRAGVRYTALPDRSEGARCGYRDAVRFRPGGALEAAYAPADLGPAARSRRRSPCGSGMSSSRRDPAPRRRVARIEHFGSLQLPAPVRPLRRGMERACRGQRSRQLPASCWRTGGGSSVIRQLGGSRTPRPPPCVTSRTEACPLSRRALARLQCAHGITPFDQADGAWGWRACR
jgi:hypothetical protein